MKSHIVHRTLRNLSKRKISMSIGQSSAAPAVSLSLKDTFDSVQGQGAGEITVADYVSGINNTYELSNTTFKPVRIEIRNPGGNQIRDAILKDDFESMKQVVGEMTSSKNFDALNGLSKQEISIYLNSLITKQFEQTLDYKKMRFPLGKSNTKSFYKEKLFFSTQINQLAKYLLSNNLISISDCVSVLKMLIQNQQLNSASVWITLLESYGDVNTNDLTYQNLRLETLGKTSSLLSAKTHNRAFKSKLYKGQTQWNSLLDDFLKFSDASPNLQTHKILISGLSKFGNLKQIEDHVDNIWGISALHEPKDTLTKTSSLYPDNELLEILISAYASNKELTSVFPILNKFEKCYEFDLSRSVLLWRILLENLDSSYSTHDGELRTEVFNNVWKLIESKSVAFNTRLYTHRLKFLRDSDLVEEAINDLSRIQKHYHSQYSSIENVRIEKLMFRYLRFIIRSIYVQDSESDQTVLSYIQAYSLTDSQFESLTEQAEIIKNEVLEDKKQFVELQKQYDQEEDDDSLW